MAVGLEQKLCASETTSCAERASLCLCFGRKVTRTIFFVFTVAARAYTSAAMHVCVCVNVHVLYIPIKLIEGHNCPKVRQYRYL